MDREVFRVSLREIHTRFTADKLTRKDKDEDTRKYSRDSGCFQDRQGNTISSEMLLFQREKGKERMHLIKHSIFHSCSRYSAF